MKTLYELSSLKYCYNPDETNSNLGQGKDTAFSISAFFQVMRNSEGARRVNAEDREWEGGRTNIHSL